MRNQQAIPLFFHRIPHYCAFLIALIAFSSSAYGETNSPFTVTRLNNAQPIIDQDLFDDVGVEEDGDNINGPSLIRIPDWISPSNRADPSAVYYLYFGNHTGDYIRMAWAEDLEGPWHLYQIGSNVNRGNRGVLDNGGADINVGNGIVIEENHLASPDVHVDNENQRIIMYFHSGSSTFFNGNEMRGQYGWVSTSRFGLDFNGNIEPVRLAASYMRTFEHGNELYSFDNSPDVRRALDVDDPWDPPSNYYSGSTIGNLWESRSGNFTQEPIIENLGLARAQLRVRHTAVRVDGDTLQLFYTRRGDSPERIMMQTVDLSVGDFENWELSYPPAEILRATSGWEGGQFAPSPSEASAAPENVNQLRDPYVFEDRDGSLYLLYAGRGEDALGIALLSTSQGGPQSPPPNMETLRPVEDAYTRGGRSDDDNFGRSETLEVKQGNSESFFRRSYLNFRINNPQSVRGATLRLYATRTSNVDITLYATQNGWDEDSITWDNAPPDGTFIDSVRLGPDDTYYEWDLSSHLAGENDENVSFVLFDAGRDNRLIRFSSSEGSNPPELVLER